MKMMLSVLLSVALTMCNTPKNVSKTENNDAVERMSSLSQDGLEEAVFASGCFWCVEAIFESVLGVKEAISGYAGGLERTANYSAVSSGRTDHAEAVKVYYDPQFVTYETLLEVFFDSHDPTTLNRQGPDQGTQYRSTVFYQNDKEKNAAQAYIDLLNKKGIYDQKIVTTLEKLYDFYPAEDYHQNYEENNPNNPYVKRVSIPRLERFKQKRPDLLKDKKSH